MSVYGGFLRGAEKAGMPRMKFFPDIGQGFGGKFPAGAEKKGERRFPGFRFRGEAEGFGPKVRGRFLQAGQDRGFQAFSPEKKVKKLPCRGFPDQAVGAEEAGFKKSFCRCGRFGLNCQARVKGSRRVNFCQLRRLYAFRLRDQEKGRIPPFKLFRRLFPAYSPGPSRVTGGKAEDAGKKDEKNPSDLSSWAEYGSWFPK
jgi:hypothetical protein